MKKLKIKKSIKRKIFLSFIIALFLSIAVFSTIKIYKQKQYEKTYEYKLLQLGYKLDETKIIIKNYKDKEIDYILTAEKDYNYLDLLNVQYFIYDNLYSYLDYIKQNTGISLRDAVKIINTNRDKEYYTDTIKTDTTKNELMLVNKYYYLDNEYTPSNLVTVSQKYSWGKAGTHKITKDTYDAFIKMWNAANEDGLYLMINSSYRTHQKQESVYKEYEEKYDKEYADQYAARPGHSEHQTGYALDIFEKNNANIKTFHESNAYLWLKDNAHKYGFILRYELENENITGYSFESWHYRYVGERVATYIYNNNITFDEYYEYYLN